MESDDSEFLGLSRTRRKCLPFGRISCVSARKGTHLLRVGAVTGEKKSWEVCLPETDDPKELAFVKEYFYATFIIGFPLSAEGA
jgi:hypothetical protein